MADLDFRAQAEGRHGRLDTLFEAVQAHRTDHVPFGVRLETLAGQVDGRQRALVQPREMT